MKEIRVCTTILERVERSKSEAVASTSHELRTPIIGMMGMIEELLESPLEEWQRADLIDARACAGETVELINRVLDLAKLQAGRLQLETLPCCLRRIVSEAATSLKHSSHSVDLHVTFDVDENVPSTLLGDPFRLSQVIAELVGPVNDELRPVNDELGPVNDEIGPVNDELGPIHDELRPVNDELGPINDELGPVNDEPPSAHPSHAVSHTASGHVAIRLWCIPPPHSSQSDAAASSQSTPSAPAAAAPTGATQASSEPPPESSAWHQLAGCVRRFPPPTRLVCHPQRPSASQVGSVGKGVGRWWGRGGREGRGGGGKVGARGEPRGGVVEAKEVDSASRACGQACEQVCSRDGMNSAGEGETQGWCGRLEEVREWVEGACAVREEGEWMVVVACEDTSGGIPPEELRWVLDPYGESCHSIDDTEEGGDLNGKGQQGIMVPQKAARNHGEDHIVWEDRITKISRGFITAAAVGAEHVGSPAARLQGSYRPPLDALPLLFTSSIPYALLFPSHPTHPLLLLPARQVAEMRGGMAVLSDASTGTTILLALPMGGGEDAGSRRLGEEGCKEEVGESGGAVGELVERENGSVGGTEGPASVVTAQPAAPQQLQAAGARALVHAHSVPHTFLLALAMGGGEDAGCRREAEQGSKEGLGESRGAGEEHVGRESELQGGIEGPPSATSGFPQCASAAQPDSPPQQHAAAAQPVSPLVRASTFPEVELERVVGEAERVVQGVVAVWGVAVVDDNAVSHMVARRTLQGYGAHVLLLPSGEEVLQALSSATPSPPIHLLLLDLHMPPGIDGFETARQVRAMEDAQQMNEADLTVDDAGTATCAPRQRLCIIALTADLDAGIKRACLEAGMDGAARKPIMAQELAAVFSAAGLS
ncbi:unnamed protein product [Closterium sp. NIES-65]|nr:unnamed protein product [Closterium sp. NIES-65]